jgi:hypothetical protein
LISRKENAGAIYGSTLSHLAGAGTHAGFHAAALTPTDSWTPYSNTPPNTYNPYPDYNGTAWAAGNMGTYVACEGPDGPIRDVTVFSGHPKAFEVPVLGSYQPFDIDSNLCFERETRLGAYGYEGETSAATQKVQKRTDWDTVDWRKLQEECVKKNANRFAAVDPAKEISRNYAPEVSNSSTVENSTMSRRQDTGEEKPLPEGLHGMPSAKITTKARTAVLLRVSSSKNYTANDMQNIRSMITELALRSGGEYTVYLMVKVENDPLPIWKDTREQAIKIGIPPEFQSMCIFWNEAMMREFYFTSPGESANTNTSISSWLPVQKFAADWPQYDFLWNWELDSRYTGHHYNLFEKLVMFAQAQPRKGLWERNERFFIPSVHGGYDTVFRKKVEELSGQNTIWGAPKVASVKPTGPVRPSQDPRDDHYAWGVGEEADFISLAPIFNPIDTTWANRSEIWGYAGEETPRRASVGMNSRCSARLLKTMNAENMRGNHLGSEMGPSTVSLLHGLKAVYAPIPMYFDRAWNGSRLDAYLNPGPKGVSGSCPNSPFGAGHEVRFEGSTWFEKAVVPRRLHNAWMGWEYRGYGGPEVGLLSFAICKVRG